MRKTFSRLFLSSTLLIPVVALVPVQAAHALSPDLVISQVYGGGGNATASYRNDFIELFNRGTTTVSLAGMSVQYASARRAPATSPPTPSLCSPDRSRQGSTTWSTRRQAEPPVCCCQRRTRSAR